MVCDPFPEITSHPRPKFRIICQQKFNFCRQIKLPPPLLNPFSGRPWLRSLENLRPIGGFLNSCASTCLYWNITVFIFIPSRHSKVLNVSSMYRWYIMSTFCTLLQIAKHRSLNGLKQFKKVIKINVYRSLIL